MLYSMSPLLLSLVLLLLLSLLCMMYYYCFLVLLVSCLLLLLLCLSLLLCFFCFFCLVCVIMLLLFLQLSIGYSADYYHYTRRPVLPGRAALAVIRGGTCLSNTVICLIYFLFFIFI